ncbi:unnamed protein product [Trichogramma brassicae]|uniref:Uncharacterized protein n=1 Tax=Trichogramma brassicae TaxID=86971 RepID=A0A6H5IQI8_9HYME|nr:unnamed protein product [Trichogramma brassicae]
MKPLLARYLRCLGVRAKAAKAMPDVRTCATAIELFPSPSPPPPPVYLHTAYTDVRVEEKNQVLMHENKIEMIHRFRNYYYPMPRRTESNIHPKGKDVHLVEFSARRSGSKFYPENSGGLGEIKTKKNETHLGGDRAVDHPRSGDHLTHQGNEHVPEAPDRRLGQGPSDAVRQVSPSAAPTESRVRLAATAAAGRPEELPRRPLHAARRQRAAQSGRRPPPAELRLRRRLGPDRLPGLGAQTGRRPADAGQALPESSARKRLSRLVSGLYVYYCNATPRPIIDV